MKHSIGIIGNGFVGSAILHGFVLHTNNVYIYDENPKRATHSLRDTVQHSDVIFLCLPTPMFETGKCDLSIINSVLSDVESYRDIDMSNKVFIIKSTVVPGTTDYCSNRFERLNFVFNPEFLTERRARLDFINTSRIVLGGDEESVKKVEDLYRVRFPYTKIIKTDSKTAELIKYMCNCFFATKVSFMNEMRQVSDATGCDWEKAMEGFITDGRIGNSHIDVPGHDGDYGFGGTCFPKDINAMIYYANEVGVDPKVMQSAWDKNLEVRNNKNWLKMLGRAISKNK